MANSKIITYDLCSPGKNYDKLYEYLKSLPDYACVCESVWFTTSTKTCSTIRNEIKAVVDSNDRIFVAELTGAAAWRNILCDGEYLKSHL